MDPTGRLHSPFAGPRPGFAAVLMVMFLVLTVVGIQVLCHVQRDEGTLAQDVRAQQLVQGVANTPEAAVEAVPEHLDARFSRGCSGHQVVTEQYDPVLSQPLAVAALPEPTGQPLAPPALLLNHRAPSSAVTARAPSLHALGISRT